MDAGYIVRWLPGRELPPMTLRITIGTPGEMAGLVRGSTRHRRRQLLLPFSPRHPHRTRPYRLVTSRPAFPRAASGPTVRVTGHDTGPGRCAILTGGSNFATTSAVRAGASVIGAGLVILCVPPGAMGADASDDFFRRPSSWRHRFRGRLLSKRA